VTLGGSNEINVIGLYTAAAAVSQLNAIGRSSAAVAAAQAAETACRVSCLNLAYNLDGCSAVSSAYITTEIHAYRICTSSSKTNNSRLLSTVPM